MSVTTASEKGRLVNIINSTNYFKTSFMSYTTHIYGNGITVPIYSSNDDRLPVPLSIASITSIPGMKCFRDLHLKTDI